jgi:hypothetical protein
MCGGRRCRGSTEEEVMPMSSGRRTVMWIVIAVIALLAIIGVAVLTNGGSGTGGGTGDGY